MSRMNVSGYMRLYLIECSVLFRSRVWFRIRVKVRIHVWLVRCFAHVFVLLYMLELSHSPVSSYCKEVCAISFWVS